jgi:hypothetical protein
VPGFTLRGFRLERSPGPPHSLVNLTRSNSGVILDQLEMAAPARAECVDIHDQSSSDDSAPIVIRNCTMRGGGAGICIEGADREDRDRPKPSGHVVIRNNTLVRCDQGVLLLGAVHNVHVVGNRILDSDHGAIDLIDLLPGAADILVANNTMLRCRAAVRIWDDHDKEDFLKCKNIRVQNNLVFKTDHPGDMIIFNHKRNSFKAKSPRDVQSLLNSPNWRFSHNWREIDPKMAKSQVLDGCIPLSPTDHELSPNAVLSLKPGDPDFLRPPKDSPLAWSGAGGHAVPSARIAALVGQAAGVANPWMACCVVAQPISQPDHALPAYVGAVPPDGVEPWNWDKTWRALTH